MDRNITPDITDKLVANSNNEPFASRKYLDGSWTLYFTHPRTQKQVVIPCSVPGNVEIELLREKIIDDPYPVDNSNAMRDFSIVDDWTYTTCFDAPSSGKGESVCLVFEGVDTIAEVILNGEIILRCENMFIPHSVDVTSKLQQCMNSLKVRIYSPELFARNFQYDAFQISRSRQAQAYLRKARHAWGWDNAPRLLTAGIWRSVYLEVQKEIRFTEVYASTQQVRKDKVWLGVNWNFQTPDVELSGYSGRLTLAYQGETQYQSTFDIDFIAGRTVFSLDTDTVRLWWPCGYGDPCLYDLNISLLKNNQDVAEWNSKIGIREIELLRTCTVSDHGEGEFLFMCNGEKIYIRGTNWKPLDALHSRAKERVQKALELCIDLNCNMVRVWGGGIYEDHEFFNLCDAHGLLVWQDFMFACEFPPRDDFFKEAVAREGAAIVKRLRNHPSLAVWCGDNEVDATFLWNTLIPPHILPSYNEISRCVLKDAVLSHDPYRPYIESSPFIDDRIAAERRLPADRKSGIFPPEDHLYPTDEFFREIYRNSKSPFIGETGPLYISSMSESLEIVNRELPRMNRLWDVPVPSSYTLDFHQTDVFFLTWKDAARKRLNHFFGSEFGLDKIEDLIWGVNIICANVFKFAIEWSRSTKWNKTGVLWWSLIDMWPQCFNYSVVDYYFKPKLPYWWIKQSQQPCCLLIIENGAECDPELFAVNDTLDTWDGSLTVRSIDEQENEHFLFTADFSVAPNQTAKIRSISRTAEPELLIVEWKHDDKKGWNHYICGNPPFSLAVYRMWCAKLSTYYNT